MEIVDGGEDKACDLFCLEEMMEIGKGVSLACVTGTSSVDRAKGVAILSLFNLNPSFGCEKKAMACCTSGVGAVESVDPKGDESLYRREISDTQKMDRFFFW